MTTPSPTPDLLVRDAIDGLTTLGATTRSEAGHLLSSWSRRDRLTVDQRRTVLDHFRTPTRDRAVEYAVVVGASVVALAVGTLPATLPLLS